MSIQAHMFRALLLASLSGLAAAQVATVTNPSTVGAINFGAEGMFIGDVDGGGLRDLVIGAIDPLGQAPDEISVISSETGAVLGSLTLINSLGRGMTFMGDLDGLAGDEFVVSAPQFGLILVCTGDLSAGFGQVLSLCTLPSGVGGDSLANVGDVNNDGRADMAVGIPALNQVLVVDLVPVLGTFSQAVPVLQTLTDARGGAFGSALVVAGNRLLVSGPNFISSTVTNAQVGYVDVFTVGSTSTLTATFAAPAGGSVAQRFGAALCSIGDLDGDGLSEYAIQSPLTTTVSVFSELTPGAPLSTAVYPGTAPRGKMAGLGDIDGDGRGDFAMSDGNLLSIFTTPTITTLARIAAPGFGTDGCVLSTVNPLRPGFVTGQPLQGASGQIRFEPLSMLRNLPNPPSMTMTGPAGARPTIGTSFNLTVSTNQFNPLLCVVKGDFGAPQNIPFGGSTIYVNLATAMDISGLFGLASTTGPAIIGLTIPNSPALIFQEVVFQAGGLDPVGTLFASNGLDLRIGSY